MKNVAHLTKNAGIYILTNTLNGKQYVGMDSNMPRRFKQHTRGIAKCGLLHEALSAVGLEHWTTQFIPYPGISREALRAVEQWYIGKLGTKHPNGYNLRGGPKALREPTAKRLKRLAAGKTDLKKRVRERRKAGATLETIMTEFNEGYGTVRAWCKDINPQADLKKRVRERRKAGKVLAAIAAEFGIAYDTVAKWCKDIKKLSPTETEVLGLLADEQVWRTSDILKHSTFTRQAVTIALKSLLGKGVIRRIKKGHYQKSSNETPVIHN